MPHVQASEYNNRTVGIRCPYTPVHIQCITNTHAHVHARMPGKVTPHAPAACACGVTSRCLIDSMQAACPLLVRKVAMQRLQHAGPTAAHVPMCCAGDHDDRVVPLHTHKLLATLQHTLAGSEDALQANPLLGRYEVRAGHGAGKPTEKVIAETADCFGFAAAITSARWVA